MIPWKIGVYQRNDYTKFEANPSSGSREVPKTKKVHANNKDNNDDTE